MSVARLIVRATLLLLCLLGERDHYCQGNANTNTNTSTSTNTSTNTNILTN
jgi:hypothetical protein